MRGDRPEDVMGPMGQREWPGRFDIWQMLCLSSAWCYRALGTQPSAGLSASCTRVHLVLLVMPGNCSFGLCNVHYDEAVGA